MKCAPKGLLLSLLAATFSFGQAPSTPNTPIKHVIIVVQENRTPDNLFQDPVLVANGADIVAPTTGGHCYTKAHGVQTVPLIAQPLNSCVDPGHAHSNWQFQFRNGNLDGACSYVPVPPANCTPLPYPCPFDSQYDCSPYTYVQNNNGHLQPYFDIAEKFGFANYTFETAQGPSFPAHQFLFSGTSAPDVFGDTNQGTSVCAPFCWQWFAAEGNQGSGRYGCLGAQGDVIPQAPPTGPEAPGYTPPGMGKFSTAGYPCYEHSTLSDLLEANSLTWRYYVNFPAGMANLWAAPNAINHICGPDTNHQNCIGADWTNNVKVAPMVQTPPAKDQQAPVLEDIENCALPSVSWAIPDSVWSDHGQPAPGNYLGPAWVADIVNAVGSQTCANNEVYWNDTVIIVVWDDWGGFYDHVAPWNCGSVCNGYSNSTGQQFVYGFRVPMLVVSAYNKQGSGTFKGYISGACGQSGLPACPNQQPQYVHDFGSILNFTEYALGQNGNPLIFPGQLPATGISPSYFYADVLAPDSYASKNCTKAVCPYSLSDFFNFNQSPTTFTPISLPTALCILPSPPYTCYNAEWFENYAPTKDDPMVPDED